MVTAIGVTGTLLDRYNRIFGADGFLRSQNVERNEETELLGYATIAGVDPLFLGDPGTGKTWLIELLVNYCLSDMSLFTHLFAKDQSADEVLGPRDVVAMKSGKIARLMDGYAPEANYCYWDEVFKASPPMLNPMLDLLANRVLKVGGNVVDCGQLITIMMSSNELPDREDLLAFRDRIGITKFVRPVRTPEGLRAVTDIQLAFQSDGLDTSGVVPLTLDDIKAIRAEVQQVQVSDAIRDVMTQAELKWSEAGHPVSQRRKGQMWKVIKTRAWANGRMEAVVDDFLPVQHMAWNHPDDAASAREIVLEFASVFTRKAARLREAMEPVVAELEKLRAQAEKADTGDEYDQLMNSGFGFIRQLKRLAREADDQIAEGKQQGQDTTEVQSVLADIRKAHEWAEDALTGIEESRP